MQTFPQGDFFVRDKKYWSGKHSEKVTKSQENPRDFSLTKISSR